MSAHTPGPWKVSEFESSHGKWYGIYRDISDDKNGYPYPVVTISIKKNEEGVFVPRIFLEKNDARLIASAPEMFELLKALSNDRVYDASAIYDATQKAKELIQKIEGEL